ncbi:MAG: dTMP kinase [Lachnospirales bacterium]
MFISFEGIDGSGKGTQIRLLLEYLDKNKIPYLHLREPGGTEVGEQVRKVVLDPQNKVQDFTEVMLYATSRAQLVEEKIIPSLDKGLLVVCDRYVDSSIAYQAVRDVPLSDIKTVNALATRGILPDVTFLIDVPHLVGLNRVYSETNGDRIEQEGAVFFEKVVDNYRKVADENSERFVVLDGEKSVEEIHKKIINYLQEHFGKLF